MNCSTYLQILSRCVHAQLLLSVSDSENMEEKESETPTSENDVQPPSVAKENSPLSQNSPKISPKDEHKQDTSSDELAVEFAKESTGKPSAISSDELENESPGASPDTSKETDSESSENKQQTSLNETESHVEALQK